MSRLQVLCAVVVLAGAGCVAAAQTTVTSLFNDPGMDVTLSASGQDIHSHQSFSPLFNGGQLTGTWSPDGLEVDPATVVETDVPTFLQYSFDSLNPNGDSALFLADLDFGDQRTLANWSVIITTVPEPGSWALLGLGGALVARRLMRRCRGAG